MPTAAEEGGETEKPRGPKGGIKHQPGREHDRKSASAKKKRFARKAARKRQQGEDEARRAWAEWDALPSEIQRLLGPSGQPKIPRPSDES
jgi:hypothetical protein